MECPISHFLHTSTYSKYLLVHTRAAHGDFLRRHRQHAGGVWEIPCMVHCMVSFKIVLPSSSTSYLRNIQESPPRPPTCMVSLLAQLTATHAVMRTRRLGLMGSTSTQNAALTLKIFTELATEMLMGGRNGLRPVIPTPTHANSGQQNTQPFLATCDLTPSVHIAVSGFACYA